MKIKFFAGLFILLLVYTSCNNQPEYDENLLVGTVRVMDRNIPFPYLIEKTPDHIFLIDHKNKVIDSSATSTPDLVPGNSIEMKDHSFLITSSKNGTWLLDKKDSLNFPYQHPLYSAQFKNAEITNDIELASFKQKLQGNLYQSEVDAAHFATPNRDLKILKTVKFSEGILETLYTYYYQNEPVYAEKEVSDYHIFERKHRIFLTTGRDRENTVNLYQVIKAGSESFSIKSFRNMEEITETFKISEAPEKGSEIRIFERCMEGQPGEYYHGNLTFEKGNDFLINKIGENAPQASGDGYITIHFTMNCNGKLGHLGLEQMDLQFQSTSFEPALVKHLIREVMNLKDWPKITSGQFYEDVHSFLMFRIKNGKITDLCP